MKQDGVTGRRGDGATRQTVLPVDLVSASPRPRVSPSESRPFALPPIRPLAERLSIVFVCLAVLHGGCAPPGGPQLDLDEVPASKVLARLCARADTVRTVSASGRVLVTQGGARFEARHRMLYAQPHLLRIDVESKPLFGLFRAQVIALVNEDSLLVYSPTHGIVFETSGDEHLDFLGPEVRWVAISGIEDVLLGLPDLMGSVALADRVRPGPDGSYEIPLNSGSDVRTLRVDSETLVVERMDVRTAEGDLIVSSTYEYRDDDSPVPRRVKIEYPANDATISLTYRDCVVNGLIDPEEFEMEVPESARRFHPRE